jgi:flagellin
MALSINNQMASMGALKNLGQTLKSLSTALGRLAAGTRINTAADDAAGLAISEQLAASLQTSGRAQQNVRDAGSALQYADGAISQVQVMSGRLQELALQSANGTYSDEQRAALQQEFSAITDAIKNVSENTEFNGQKLLDGSQLTVQIGTDGGATSSLQVGGVNVRAIASQLSALNIGTQSGAQSAVDTVRQLSSDLADQRASRVGAAYNRLEAIGQTLENRRSAESSALAQIRDSDIASETANLSKYQILTQAGISVLAQANRLNAGSIQLLLG